MKAMVYTNYGPPEVLQLKEIPKPAPRDHEVLVRVRATTVTIGDTIMRGLKIPVPGWQKVMARLYLGWNKPKRPILGMELAGEIESMGRRVTRFQPGDAVFASTFAAGFGGYAEYKCLPEKGVMELKPAALTFEAAAAAPGAGMTALACLKKGNVQPGREVLIYGASGAVGTNAVQLAAHHFGARVTGVCSTANLALVASLGAGRVIDYTREDFTRNGERYDVIFDAVGKLSPEQKKRASAQAACYLNVHTDSDGGDRREYLLLLKGIAEAGQLKPLIDRVYTFEQIAEAHRYVEQGHKKGNVVITVKADGEA